MRKGLFYTMISFSLLLVIGSGLSQAASIAVGDGSDSPGAQDVRVPVYLTTEAEENIAALRFNVRYDNYKLTFNGVTAGEAALNAGKVVHADIIYQSYPNVEGMFEIIVSGSDQNRIENGTIAVISFDIKTFASAGETDIEVDYVIAENPDAISISVSTVDGSITIGSDGDVNEKDPLEYPNSYDLGGCFIETINRY